MSARAEIRMWADSVADSNQHLRMRSNPLAAKSCVRSPLDESLLARVRR